MTDKKLVAQLKDAIGESVDVFATAKTQITGYALCADDNLWTVYHVATALPLGGSRRHWASPVEWSLVARSAKPTFSRISESLRRSALESSEAGRLSVHVRTAYDSLVEALEQSKERLSSLKVPKSDLLLLAVSTDPAEHLTQMSIESAMRLNSKALFVRWNEAMHP